MTRKLTIEIDGYLLGKIRQEAKRDGLSPEQVIVRSLNSEFFDYDDFTWLNGDPRDPLPPLDPNEPTVAWEDVRAEMIARLGPSRKKSD